MKNMQELVLVKQAEFEDVVLDCYVELNQIDKGDFWATREQIGQLLGYTDPSDAIKKIHKRNAERLDKFSRGDKLSLHEEGRTVTREVVLYNFKGLLEICRYSNQPKADAIMDWLWEVADEIRRTGSYSAKAKRSRRTLSSFKAAEVLIDKAFKCKTSADWQPVAALDKVFQDNYGYSVLEVAEIQPKMQPAKPVGRDEELWQHIVSTFAPDEWFTTSALMRTLPRNTLCPRQVRRYLADFVAKKMLCRRGCLKSSEYSRLKKY